MPGAVAPAVSCARELGKRTRVVTGTTGQPGIPRAMLDDLFRALLGVPGVLVTVACSRRLDTSIGGSGPHGFVERVTHAYVLRAPSRPSLPRLTFRDDWP
jgi:hypothetical protein